jgi:ATP-dependent helicase/nuclease subunit A
VIPSQLAEKATSVKLSSVLKLGDSVGVDRGTLFHAWLERTPWLEEGPPPDSELKRIAEVLGAKPLDVDRFVSQFRLMLQLPGVSDLLSRRCYHSPEGLPFSPRVRAELAAGTCELDLDQERKFSVIDGGQLISGSIDRLVLIRRHGQVAAADIIDFKTDALSGDEESAVQDKVAAYRDQMRSYARAVGLMYQLAPERIATRLVMLATGQVVTVE